MEDRKFDKGKRLSNADMKDGRRFVVQRVGSTGDYSYTEGYVDNDIIRYFNLNDGEQIMEDGNWDGDTFVHSSGNRFVFYEFVEVK